MRDDLGRTFDLPRTAKKYARMKGALGTSPSKAQLFIDVMADVTGQRDRQHGFGNKDASGPVAHAIKEAAPRTLVIHPKDRSTEFLKPIYAGLDCTVISDPIPRAKMMELVKSHDQVFMMGHGSPIGLFWFDYSLGVDFGMELAKKPFGLYIWCNADAYAYNHRLSGFVTGMFISEVGEARMFRITATQEEVDVSNNLFAQTVRRVLDGQAPMSQVKQCYTNAQCQITTFNNERLYVFVKGEPTPALHATSQARYYYDEPVKTQKYLDTAFDADEFGWARHQSKRAGAEDIQQGDLPSYEDIWYSDVLDGMTDEEIEDFMRNHYPEEFKRDYPEGKPPDFWDSIKRRHVANLVEDDVEALAGSALRPTVMDVKFDKVGWKEVEIPPDLIAKFQGAGWNDGITLLLDYLNGTFGPQFGLVDELGPTDHLHRGGKHPMKVYATPRAIEPI